MKDNLYVLHFVYDVNGGIGSVIKNIVDYQLEKGYKVAIIYSLYNEEFFNSLNKEIKCYENKHLKFPGEKMLFGLKISKFYEKLSRENPECNIVVHAHNVATIGVLSNIKKIPVVCTIHGISRNGIKSLRGEISNKIYKLILGNLTKNKKNICAVSNHTKEYYSKFVKKTNIETVYNGINVNPTNPIKNKETFVIGHVGDISYSKGWDTTFEAYKLLQDEYKNKIKFVFAGKILDISEQEIRNEIEKNNLNKKAVYLGKVQNAAVNVIPNLDVLILASISEGLPTVILEAQAKGIPVIATKVGGVPEIIENNKNGFLVEKNPIEISEKIKELYHDRKKLKEMSEYSKKIFDENFNVLTAGGKYDEIYIEALKKVIVYDN